MVNSQTVGKVIQQYREKKGISQEVASGLAGINRTHWSAIENGVRKPAMDTFFSVCYALEAEPNQVVRDIEIAIQEMPEEYPDKYAGDTDEE